VDPEVGGSSPPNRTISPAHDLPHAGSIPERFKGDLLNAAYASDLIELIDAERPALWAHGHAHESFDTESHPYASLPTRGAVAARTGSSIRDWW
jgi:hypothetical protein